MGQIRVIFLSAALMPAVCAARGGAAPPCANPQTPRDVTLYDATSPASMIRVDPESWQRLTYTPRTAGASPQTLYLCGQHYHLPVENVQHCDGEITAGDKWLDRGVPANGAIIEVHTVYAARARQPCNDPEGLDCCQTPPFLVRAFNARVVGDPHPGVRDLSRKDLGVAPIVPPAPSGHRLAEWSGSTTGADRQPDECKPAAQWSFVVDCGLTVDQDKLRGFAGPQQARALQAADRLSKDLTQVKPHR